MVGPLLAGIELGGTKAVVLVAREGVILEEARIATTGPYVTIDACCAALTGWQAKHGDIAALGVGSFGPLGLDPALPDFGLITNTPKPGWSGTDVLGALNQHFDVPIGFDTDVAGAALAEYRWGAARGACVVVYITIGTGVGAGVLVEGKIVHGLVHPEAGHVRLRRRADDDFAGNCGFHGDCLEGLVSGPAIMARTGRPAHFIGDDDPIWVVVADNIAEFTTMLLLTLSADRIIIGGGVGHSHGHLLPAIRDRTAALLAGYVPAAARDKLDTIICAPGLGDASGPRGTLALAEAALSV